MGSVEHVSGEKRGQRGEQRQPFTRGQRVRVGPTAPFEIRGRTAVVDAVSAWDCVLSFDPVTSEGRLISVPLEQIEASA